MAADHYIDAQTDDGMPDLVRLYLRCDHDESSPFWSDTEGECLVMQWYEAIQWEAFRWREDVAIPGDIDLPTPIGVEPDGDDGWVIWPTGVER